MMNKKFRVFMAQCKEDRGLAARFDTMFRLGVELLSCKFRIIKREMSEGEGMTDVEKKELHTRSSAFKEAKQLLLDSATAKGIPIIHFTTSDILWACV